MNPLTRVRLIASLACALGLFAASTAKPEPSPPKRDDHAILMKGREALQHGDPQRAITDYFDEVIDAYDATFKDSTKIVYSARGMEQVFIYSALPNPDKREVEVLGPDWADAYLMKGYALTELNRGAEAQAALEAAVRLAPLNAQALAELAYTYQAMKNCDKSIDLYERSASAAEFASSKETRTADLTRAWRGQGFCLVEQGKFDAAEALYKKCLTLDRSDSKARGELDYIRRTRPH